MLVLANVLYIAAVKKLTDLAKEVLPNTLLNRYVQLTAIVIGIGVAFAMAHSDWAGSFKLGEVITLKSANTWSIIIYGLVGGAGAGVWNDHIDGHNPDVAPDPPLIGHD